MEFQSKITVHTSQPSFKILIPTVEHKAETAAVHIYTQVLSFNALKKKKKGNFQCSKESIYRIIFY